MTFDQFEQERREQAEREARSREERSSASQEALVAVQAELADLAANIARNAQYPPDTRLVQRRTTYSNETRRKGWFPFVKSQDGIVRHSEIDFRADGWDLGNMGNSDPLYLTTALHWYLDTSGGLWFDIESALYVKGLTYDRGAPSNRTDQQRAMLTRLSNERSTGDIPTPIVRATGGWERKLRGERARIDFEQLHHDYVNSSRAHVKFDHLFTVPREYRLEIQTPYAFDWGSWPGIGKKSDWLYYLPWETPVPIVEYTYQQALRKGIIA